MWQKFCQNLLWASRSWVFDSPIPPAADFGQKGCKSRWIGQGGQGTHPFHLLLGEKQTLFYGVADFCQKGCKSKQQRNILLMKYRAIFMKYWTKIHIPTLSRLRLTLWFLRLKFQDLSHQYQNFTFKKLISRKMKTFQLF